MTAGSWEVHNDADSIQVVIDANATTASRITLGLKNKDVAIVIIHQTS